MICKNCGVELEHDMQECPLCGQSVSGTNTAQEADITFGGQAFYYQKMSTPQKKFTWEIVSLILFSSAVASFVVNFILNYRITWSALPIAICLAGFCYISLFAFWNQSTIIKIAGGFVLSCLCFVIVDALTRGISWSVRLAIPLLFAGNLVTVALITAVRLSRYKGINLVAYAFLGGAILCLFVDGILSYSKSGLFQIQWSVIVVACTIPVVIVLLFQHFMLKKGRSLKKTFHI